MASLRRTATVRILIVDDHPVFRHGLKLLLAQETDLQVTGEAPDGVAALEQARQLQPDIVVLDLALPGLHGLDVLRELGEVAPQARVIVLTVAIEQPQIVEALQLGARGILLKDAALELIVECIRTVARGGYWVLREAVAEIRSYLEENAVRPVRQLTRREREIVEAILAGCSNREIAQRFGITEDTVKHHLSSVYAKLGVSNRLELALLVVRTGLLRHPANP
jgi:two-component system nitrate/nitrite response regulator NarL